MQTLQRSERFPARGGYLPFALVIRDKGLGEYERYVVHYEVEQENGSVSYHQGGYHDDLAVAQVDYDVRLQRELNLRGI